MSKKIFSVLLSLALLISLIPTSFAYAAGGTCEFSIVPDAAEVERGDTINFTVKVEQTGLLAGIEVKLAAIPEGLTFVSGTVDDNAEEALGFADLSWTKSSKKLTGYYDDEPFAGEDEVTLMTFQCTVDDDAEYKEYEIAFAEDTLFASDENGEPKATTQIVAKVTVVPTPVAAEGVEITEADLSLDLGEKYTLSYTVNPAEATNKAVTFSSSNPEVAAVNAETGEVEGKAEGTATITVTTVDGGFTDTCEVTVECKNHNYVENADEKYLVSGADCVNAPVYHKSCDKCGAEGTETFSAGTKLGHAYTEKIADAAHLKTASANCQTAAEYWYDCARCDANAKDDEEAADKWYVSEEFAGHDFTGAWHKDADGHWKECQTAGCTAKDTKLDHNPSDNGGNCAVATECTECGWEITAAGEHNFTGEWHHDENGHWKVCLNGTCGAKDEVIPHTGEDDGDCKTAVVCVCGEVVTAAAADHDMVWNSDAEKHWKECQREGCEAAEEAVAHTAQDDGNCKTALICECGRTIVTAASAHSYYNAIWSYDENSHWHVCVNGSCVAKDSVIRHSGEDDGDCTTAVVCVCGREVKAAAADHDMVWNYDGENHWKECQNEGCEAAEEAVKHTAQDDNNCATAVVCECGKELKAAATHDFSGEWQKNEEGHFHVCQNDGCVIEEEAIPHSGEDDGDCKTAVVCVCGEVVTAAAADHDMVWNSDTENHWKECQREGCEAAEEAVAHTAQDDNDCTTAVVCECGREVKAAAADHDMVWNFDGENHWKECQNEGCEAAEEAVKHTAQDDNNCATAVVCECGKELKAAAAHDFSGEWQKNEEGHWYVCQNDDCLVKDTVVSHTCEDDNNCLTPVECDVCKYIVVDNAPAHDFSGEWQKDDEGHFHVCQNDGCVAEDETIPHSGEDDGDCETAVVCVCGHEVTAAKEAHDFTGEWHKNEGGHWHECLNAGCTVADNEVPHSGEDDGDCTTAVVCVCGEEVTAAKEAHDYTGEWKKDANGHWHECLTDGCKAKETVAKHENGNDDICDICGYDSTSYIPRPPYTPPTPPAPPVVDPEVPTEPETPAVDENAELKASVDKIELVARSSMSKAEGKKAVKLRWFDKNGSDLKFMDGFQVFRSTKRYSGFGKKPFFTTTRTVYWNTAIEDGMKYYYKVRGFVEIGDEKYFTEWSKKAWRTVK